MVQISSYSLYVLAFSSIAFGLYCLVKGGDWTVSSATFVATRFGFTPLFIGATIVAFGTSLPELFTSVNANLSGYPGLSLGNIIGSNIANVMLILGTTAIFYRIKGNRSEIYNDLAMMSFATVILITFMLSGAIPSWAGALMFASLVIFVAYQGLSGNVAPHGDISDDEILSISDPKKAGLILIAGLVALGLGSEILVVGAVSGARAFGISEAIIGVTLVAVGTSLPELATCIAAARKLQTDLILGNIIGSNIFNVLSIVGITAMLKPLIVVPEVTGVQMWSMGLVGIGFALWMATISAIGRTAGIGMLLIYLIFVVYQYAPSPL